MRVPLLIFKSDKRILQTYSICVLVEENSLVLLSLIIYVLFYYFICCGLIKDWVLKCSYISIARIDRICSKNIFIYSFWIFLKSSISRIGNYKLHWIMRALFLYFRNLRTSENRKAKLYNSMLTRVNLRLESLLKENRILFLMFLTEKLSLKIKEA